MKCLPHGRLAGFLKFASKALAAIVVLASLAVLLGWVLNVAVLKGGAAGGTAMKPNSAVAFILSGISVWLLRHPRTQRFAHVFALLCALAVTGIGVATLVEYVFERDLRIDVWPIFAAQMGPEDSARMAGTTAFNFTLVGLSLLLLHLHCGPRAVMWLLLPVIAISLLALLGHIYEIDMLFAYAMGVHTVAAFLMLVIGVTFAYREHGLVGIIISDSAGGVMARRLLPAAILLPVLLAWLRLEGQHRGWYPLETGVAIFAVVIMGIFASLVCWNACTLHRLDAQRKAAQAALRASEERLQLALKSGRIGTWNWNTETDESSSDEYLSLLFGLPPGSYTGGLKMFKTIIHPDDWAGLNEALSASVNEGKLLDTEFRVVWPDASVHFIICRGKAYDDETDHPVNMAGICLDVTERRRTEEALQASEERLNLALESANIGTWGWEIASQVADCDDTTTQLFGVEPGGMTVPEMFVKALHPDDVERVRNEIFKCVNDGEGFDTEFRVVWPDGSQRWIASFGKVHNDSSGRAERMLGVCQDITERKLAEQELNATAAALERSNKELETFAYAASHDLQEPARAVTGCVELLQRRTEDKLDESSKELMKHIVEAAARMRNLINDLLTYSRIGARGHPLELTDCEKVLADTLANLETAISETNAVVTHDPLPSIMADPTQMGQLFQNLISNAIKYHGAAPPSIHLSAKRQEKEWLFSVRDHGIGIEPAYFDRIFVLFQRLHTRSEYPGTGIGLTVCKKIVERHGGLIWLESEQGNGSTFRFTIPDSK